METLTRQFLNDVCVKFVYNEKKQLIDNCIHFIYFFYVFNLYLIVSLPCMIYLYFS